MGKTLVGRLRIPQEGSNSCRWSTISYEIVPGGFMHLLGGAGDDKGAHDVWPSSLT